MIRRRRLFESDSVRRISNDIRTAMSKRTSRNISKYQSLKKEVEGGVERKARLLEIKYEKLMKILSDASDSVEELSRLYDELPYDAGVENFYDFMDGEPVSIPIPGGTIDENADGTGWNLFWFKLDNNLQVCAEVDNDVIEAYYPGSSDFDESVKIGDASGVARFESSFLGNPKNVDTLISMAEKMRDYIETKSEEWLKLVDRKYVRGMKESRSLRGRTLRESRLRGFRRR